MTQDAWSDRTLLAIYTSARRLLITGLSVMQSCPMHEPDTVSSVRHDMQLRYNSTDYLDFQDEYCTTTSDKRSREYSTTLRRYIISCCSRKGNNCRLSRRETRLGTANPSERTTDNGMQQT